MKATMTIIYLVAALLVSQVSMATDNSEDYQDLLERVTCLENAVDELVDSTNSHIRGRDL